MYSVHLFYAYVTVCEIFFSLDLFLSDIEETHIKFDTIKQI